MSTLLCRREILAGLLPLSMAGQGHHGQHMPGMQDMRTIHALFDAHEGIRRTTVKLDNGVQATTESDNPRVAALLQEHVASMKQRLEHHHPIRQWDPLYAALFSHYKQIRLTIANLPKGVRIVQTSDDPKVVRLIHAHADAVTGFVVNGYRDMHEEHALPE